jgi:hypothetical protein
MNTDTMKNSSTEVGTAECDDRCDDRFDNSLRVLVLQLRLAA